MVRGFALVMLAISLPAGANPAPSSPIRQVSDARLSDGVPIWIEITATDAFVVIDAWRDARHERAYLVVPLKNTAMFAAIQKAYAAQTSIGVVWVEVPANGTPGPPWRVPEHHTYWSLQSVFDLSPASVKPYTAPPRALTIHGDVDE